MVMLKEDVELVERYCANRDPVLREEIVLRYVPLVHYVLSRLGISRSMGMDYEDAASQGMIGLIEAVDRYDASREAQFSTYATYRIRGRVLDHLRSLDWLSRGARRRARSVQDAIDVLWRRMGRLPTDEELGDFLGLDPETLQKALVDASHVIVSLDTLVNTDGEEEIPLHEMLADETQLEPGDDFEQRDLKSYLVNVLASLPEREQMVLSLYYYDGLTLKEIGAVLNFSESRACQLHARAIMNLRAALHSFTNAEVEV